MAVLSPGVLTTGSHTTLVRGIAIGIGCLFGVGGLLGAWACLAGGNRVPRWTADSEGIALWSLLGSVEVPWADVRAIGVGYQRSPRISSMVRPKQDEAIEIFLVQPDPGRRYPRLKTLLVSDDPLRPELPSERVRMVSIESDLEGKLGVAVKATAPDRWLGSYERPWERIPGR